MSPQQAFKSQLLQEGIADTEILGKQTPSGSKGIDQQNCIDFLDRSVDGVSHDATIALRDVKDTANCVGCRASLIHLPACIARYKAEGPDIQISRVFVSSLTNPQLNAAQLTSRWVSVLPAGDGPAMRLTASSPS